MAHGPDNRSRRPPRLYLPLALLSFTALLWAISVVGIVDRGGKAIDVILADGALTVEWGGPWGERRYYHNCRNTWRQAELSRPGATVCIEFAEPRAFPVPTSAKWTLDVAPFRAITSPAFWNSQRLGLRIPIADNVGYPILFNRVELPLIWLSLPPLLWLAMRIRKRGLAKPGHCPACSYDLTGNTSGICPEGGRG